MKQKDLEKHLRRHGCELHHHGGKHDVWMNQVTLRRVPIPRRREQKRGTVKSICQTLGIPTPS